MAIGMQEVKKFYRAIARNHPNPVSKQSLLMEMGLSRHDFEHFLVVVTYILPVWEDTPKKPKDASLGLLTTIPEEKLDKMIKDRFLAVGRSIGEESWETDPQSFESS